MPKIATSSSRSHVLGFELQHVLSELLVSVFKDPKNEQEKIEESDQNSTSQSR